MSFVNTDYLVPYAVLVVHMNLGVLGGAAPGVALTPQKRGPCPLPNGWQGRLPNCKACPRWVLLRIPQDLYRNIPDAVARFLI